MKFKIHNSKYSDHLIIEGEDIEEVREIAKSETNRRGWKDKDCWSERIED